MAGHVVRIALIGAGALMALAPEAGAVDLLSHRAAYRLSLADTAGSSGVVEVRGGLVMEWRADCDGWVSNQRLGFVAATDEGPGFNYDVRFSSWESSDNTKLRFTIRAYDDGKVSEEFRGQATLDEPGGKGSARYAEPEENVVELPAGTVFPTEHVRRLIEAAEAGERVVTHAVFDGSGKQALTQVTAVIGQPREAAGEGGREHRWPVGLAYYGLEDTDTLPDFEIAFELSDRGVLHDVLLDYGDLALKGILEKLEPLPLPECR